MMVLSVASNARSWIERIWSGIADRGEHYVAMPDESVPIRQRYELLANALLSERGEAAGAAVARELLSVLRRLTTGESQDFQQFLAMEFNPPTDPLRAAVETYLAKPSPQHAMALFEASESPRQELLRRMNMAPGGTAALVDMRVAVLRRMQTAPQLRLLNADLQHLFSSWFNRGFLELRRIDWGTPAVVLEKLIAYEAVHEIQGWDDLRRRLAPDRRCFAFFHPALPDEPLIFVQIALMAGLANSIQTTLTAPIMQMDGRADGGFDTAIFYSISNCQEGLRGISFGNFLIKQVVEELKAECPTLRQFATLSPVPGFRQWLVRRLKDSSASEGLLPTEAHALTKLVPGEDTLTSSDLIEVVTCDGWWEDPAREAALQGPLRRLCAEYLTRPNKGLRGIDSVARFHLGNGARLERINWLANTSARGLLESYGMMVNYLYDLEAIEANHEAFVRTGIVARAPSIDSHLQLGSAQPGMASRSRLRVA